MLHQRRVVPTSSPHVAGMLPASWRQGRVVAFGSGWCEVESREERVARNEATAREINEQIEQGHAGAPPGEHVRVLCECGRLECDRVLAITIAEYEALRGDARRFAVARGHVMPEVERVVAETDRYVVVAKREGTPAAVAVEEDPRA